MGITYTDKLSSLNHRSKDMDGSITQTDPNAVSGTKISRPLSAHIQDSSNAGQPAFEPLEAGNSAESETHYPTGGKFAVVVMALGLSIVVVGLVCTPLVCLFICTPDGA